MAGCPARDAPGNGIDQFNHQAFSYPEGTTIQVFVRDNNIDQALKALKRKLQREGFFRELRRRRAYEKPSERRTRKASEAVRRSRKLARKRAQREGLIPTKPRGGTASR